MNDDLVLCRMDGDVTSDGFEQPTKEEKQIVHDSPISSNFFTIKNIPFFNILEIKACM